MAEHSIFSPLSESVANGAGNRGRTGQESQHRSRTWGTASTLLWSLVGCGLVIGLVQLLPAVPSSGRAIVCLYGLALVAWATNVAPAGWIGLIIVIAGTLLPVVPGASLTSLLSSNIVWLIFAAFILSEAMQQSGLAQRCLNHILASNPTPQRICWRLTGVLILLAFCVPSTSARSALVLPFVRSSVLGASSSLQRCLQLLIPSVVLMSTPITLYGAASHLIANEMLQGTGHEPFTFTRWLIVAAPFGLAITLIAAWLVLQRHGPSQTRLDRRVYTPHPVQWSRAEILTITVLLALFVAVFTIHWHGWTFSTLLLVAALVLVMPRWGVLDWRETLRRTPWDLLLFAASAVWLTQALVDSGTGAWLAQQFLAMVPLQAVHSVVIVLMLGVIAVTAHLYIPSHTARVAVLLPPALAVADQMQWNPATITLILVVGLDYCLTFPVSSKAILLFELDQQQTADLFWLSLYLMPLYSLLMATCYVVWWCPLGWSL